MVSKAKAKKNFKVPNAYIIVIGMMVFVAILTYIIPAGQYATIVNEDTGATYLDPTSFKFIEQTGISLWQFINSFYEGLLKNSEVIMFLFLLGGYFKIIIDTKAIDGFISLLIDKLGNKIILVVPIFMLVISLLGAAGVLINPVIAFIPIGMVLCQRLKLDPICAVALTFIAAYSGFSTSPMCAPTVQIAQNIAGIPVLSGFGYRSVVWLLIYLATTFYVMRYVKKVLKDSKNSIVYGEYEEKDTSELNVKFEKSHGLVMLTMVLGFGLYTWGALKNGWGMNYMSGIFLVVAIISGIISKLSAEDMVKLFVEGCREMVFSAMLIGCAAAISIILTEGNIIHTITYGFAQILSKLPSLISAPVMFFANVIVNLFVSSGSGQAVIVMPIMAPLSDLIGISRQIAVCAYQYGDGLSNVIFPTNGTMMACIARAGVGYDKWMKWILPLFGIWTVIISIALIVGVVIGV